MLSDDALTLPFLHDGRMVLPNDGDERRKIVLISYQRERFLLTGSLPGKPVFCLDDSPEGVIASLLVRNG